MGDVLGDLHATQDLAVGSFDGRRGHDNRPPAAIKADDVEEVPHRGLAVQQRPGDPPFLWPDRLSRLMAVRYESIVFEHVVRVPGVALYGRRHLVDLREPSQGIGDDDPHREASIMARSMALSFSSPVEALSCSVMSRKAATLAGRPSYMISRPLTTVRRNVPSPEQMEAS